MSKRNRTETETDYMTGLDYLSGKEKPVDYKLAEQYFLKAAEKKHALACLRVGLLYLSTKDPEETTQKKGFTWIQKAMEYGELAAHIELANCYLYGCGTDKDEKTGVKLMEQAAVLGCPKAQFFFCKLLEEGVYINQDLPRAWGYLAASAASGYSRSQVKLGYYFQEGMIKKKPIESINVITGNRKPIAYQYFSHKGPPNFAEALYWYEKAIEQGVKEAFLAATYIYMGGSETSELKNFTRAKALLTSPIVNNLPEAQVNLGIIYNTEGDSKLAIAQFHKAIELSNNAFAKTNLGLLYLAGRGLNKDVKEAVRLLTEASNGGDNSANFHLVSLYDRGNPPFERDETKALEFLTKIAASGNDYFQISLATRLLAKNTPETDQQAVTWLRKVVEHKNKTNRLIALKYLGACYLDSRGVPPDDKNIEIGKNFLIESASGGEVSAQFILAESLELGTQLKQNKAEAAKRYLAGGKSLIHTDLTHIFLPCADKLMEVATWYENGDIKLSVRETRLETRACYIQALKLGCNDALYPLALSHYAEYIETYSKNSALYLVAAEYFRQAALIGHNKNAFKALSNPPSSLLAAIAIKESSRNHDDEIVQSIFFSYIYCLLTVTDQDSEKETIKAQNIYYHHLSRLKGTDLAKNFQLKCRSFYTLLTNDKYRTAADTFFKDQFSSDSTDLFLDALNHLFSVQKKPKKSQQPKIKVDSEQKSQEKQTAKQKKRQRQKEKKQRLQASAVPKKEQKENFPLKEDQKIEVDLYLNQDQEPEPEREREHSSVPSTSSSLAENCATFFAIQLSEPSRDYPELKKTHTPQPLSLLKQLLKEKALINFTLKPEKEQWILSEKDFRTLAKKLKANKSLQQAHMNGVSLENNELQALRKGLTQMPSLVCLDFSETNLTTEKLETLALLISENPFLTFFNISGNNLNNSERNRSALVKILSNNSLLFCLVRDSEEKDEKIDALLQNNKKNFIDTICIAINEDDPYTLMALLCHDTIKRNCNPLTDIASEKIDGREVNLLTYAKNVSLACYEKMKIHWLSRYHDPDQRPTTLSNFYVQPFSLYQNPQQILLPITSLPILGFENQFNIHL